MNTTDRIKAQAKRTEAQLGEYIEDSKAQLDERLDDAQTAVKDAKTAAKANFGKDKIQHLIVGCAVVLGVFALLATAKWDIGASLALATTAVGVAWEAAQKFRGEGVPSVLDAVATAAPGFVAWGVLAFFGLY